MEPRIAVCITTTPNRKQLFEQSFKHLRENTPNDVSYKIYLDEKYEGIAKAKNKCLAMCDGFDFVFLLDDDIFALDKSWTDEYINSGLEHAMYIFDRRLLIKSEQYFSYDLPRGCMLFLTRKAIDTAGGMDEDFKVWGYEHAEYSRRIFNMGLTPAPFIDIPNVIDLFYSYDKWQACKSSVSDSQRMQSIPANYHLYQQKYYSKEFKPFR